MVSLGPEIGVAGGLIAGGVQWLAGGILGRYGRSDPDPPDISWESGWRDPRGDPDPGGPGGPPFSNATNVTKPFDLGHLSYSSKESGPSCLNPNKCSKQFFSMASSRRHSRRHRSKKHRSSRRRSRRSRRSSFNNQKGVITVKKTCCVEVPLNDDYTAVNKQYGLTFTLNSMRSGVTTGTWPPTGTNVNLFSSYIAMYEQYRIKKVEITWSWDIKNTNAFAMVAAGTMPAANMNVLSRTCWPMAYATDYNNADQEPFEKLLERPDCKVAYAWTNDMPSLKVRPKPCQTIASTSNTMEKTPWLDTANPAIVHYGVKATYKTDHLNTNAAPKFIGNEIRWETWTVQFRGLKNATVL